MSGENGSDAVDPNMSARAETERPTPPALAPRVLIVEDNIEMRKFLRQVLGHHGYELLEASDGAEGVQIARQEHPDLILMDLSLPQLDGLEATRQIKNDAQLSHIPVIAVTAHARSSDEQRAREAGCDGYLSKPYSLRSLVDLVQSFLPIQHGS